MTLTGRHIFWLMFTFELGDMILLTVSPTIQDAKQDAWISYILGTFIAFFIVYIAVKVGQQFPKDSFVQYTKKLVGSFLGVIIIILYIVQWLTVVPLILVETANFINTILLPQTLTSIIYLLIIFLLIYIMYSGGVETIGLISEVFGPLIIISLLIMLILVSNEFHLKYLLPVFNDVSFPAIWKGALNPLSFLGESVIMLMLVYFAKEDAKVLKNALWGMMLSAFLFG